MLSESVAWTVKGLVECDYCGELTNATCPTCSACLECCECEEDPDDFDADELGDDPEG